jgi:hypothetical protein
MMFKLFLAWKIFLEPLLLAPFLILAALISTRLAKLKRWADYSAKAK